MNNYKYTLLVITKNRAALLNHLLDVKTFPYTDIQMLVVDGSSCKLDGINLHNNVTYLHMPGKSFSERMLAGAKNSSTDIVGVCGDDDIVNERVWINAAKFLDCNDGYSSIIGKTPKYRVDKKSKKIQVTLASSNSIYSYQDGFNIKSTVKRLYFSSDKHYCLAYSIMRRKDVIRFFEKYGRSDSEIFNYEYLVTNFMLLSGRVKIIDEYFMVRLMDSGINSIPKTDHFWMCELFIKYKNQLKTMLLDFNLDNIAAERISLKCGKFVMNQKIRIFMKHDICDSRLYRVVKKIYYYRNFMKRIRTKKKGIEALSESKFLRDSLVYYKILQEKKLIASKKYLTNHGSDVTGVK